MTGERQQGWLDIRGGGGGSEAPHHCLREQAVGMGKVSLGGGSALDGEPCCTTEVLMAKSHCHPCKDGFIKLFLSPTCHRESLCTCHLMLKRRCYS